MYKDPIHVGSVEAVPGVATLTMSNDEVHARQRRALSHPFSIKALLGQQDIVNSAIRKFRRDYLAYSNNKTRRRLADSERDHHDFIYYILRNNKSKRLLSEEEILVNSALFMSETTASFIIGLTNLFIKHRYVYDKLVTEIRGTFTVEDNIRFEILKVRWHIREGV
ncbi:hypothetical protein ACRE_090950 [Hapsidospora chrysogenum ATCC 11550]|uniref:Uncharacterized protein n=1 Tax=Hapsidospora chrysogenum (strain ATCC 11550 / CBS 779.69 / DSM 880 / IAM 14645 / JCM 23072 / IMI 49137) TaxID=857340 RepID=A0A086ST11_HAPC1|nr:hypothetical protein ACRE_090950 [Hapsidospora chrysogenum ATCC 11550]